MFLVLCAFLLAVIVARLDSNSYSAQRSTMSLVCAFMGAFVLALGTMHPEQPVSLTMDMVSFAHHEGGVPALALVEFEATPQRPGLLVPIHVRLGMGMLGLWLTMIAAALVGLVVCKPESWFEAERNGWALVCIAPWFDYLRCLVEDITFVFLGEFVFSISDGI